MKKKVNRRELAELDKFDRKQKKHSSSKSKSSKHKFSIYDEFGDQDMGNYSMYIDSNKE